MVKGNHIWLRWHGCRHVAVIRPEVLAQLVGYDCELVELRRRLKCRMWGIRRRVRVETARPSRQIEIRGSFPGTGRLWSSSPAWAWSICTLDGFPKFHGNVGNSTGNARLSRDETVSVLGRQLKVHGNG
jgi:hypothetical protein